LKCNEINATNEPQKQGSYNHLKLFSEDSRII